MTDENTNTTTDPQEQPTQASGETKTYTQAEIDAIVAGRLSKQDKAFEKRLADELKKAEDRAKLGEAERLQAERDDLAKQLETERNEKTEALLRVNLAKLTDVDYALFKVQQAPEKYLDKDGKVLVEALVKDFPALNPQPDPKRGPAPTTGGGGSAKGFDMNAAIRQAAGRQGS